MSLMFIVVMISIAMYMQQTVLSCVLMPLQYEVHAEHKVRQEQNVVLLTEAPHSTLFFCKCEKGDCLSVTGSYIIVNMVTKNPMAQGHFVSNQQLSNCIHKMALWSS